MSRLYGTARTYGEILFKKAQMPTTPCVRYFADVDKLKQGEVVPVTEPEIFKPPKINICNRFSQTENKAAGSRPQKAELREMVAKMMITEVADHYGVSYTTVRSWMRAYDMRKMDLEVR